MAKITKRLSSTVATVIGINPTTTVAERRKVILHGKTTKSARDVLREAIADDFKPSYIESVKIAVVSYEMPAAEFIKLATVTAKEEFEQEINEIKWGKENENYQ